MNRLYGLILIFMIIVVVHAAWLRPAEITPEQLAQIRSKSPSPFLQSFEGHLITVNHGDLQVAGKNSLHGIDYVAFYYSASWCPPCRAFTPKLVDFYRSFKATHPNFELIFISHDENEDAMFDYMKTESMPWLTLRFGDVSASALDANKYCGPGIPCLVLTDASGKVLSDSFDGKTYLGPEHVMNDIQQLVSDP